MRDFVEISGLEPELREPESLVLPLHHISVIWTANIEVIPKISKYFAQCVKNRSVVQGGGGAGIVVTSDSIAYGISTDETFTGQPCRSQWFSATDFKLTRTGD